MYNAFVLNLKNPVSSMTTIASNPEAVEFQREMYTNGLDHLFSKVQIFILRRLYNTQYRSTLWPTPSTSLQPLLKATKISNKNRPLVARSRKCLCGAQTRCRCPKEVGSTYSAGPVSVHSSNLESRIISSAMNGGGSSTVSNSGLSMDVKNGSDLGLEFDSNHWWSVSTVKEKENLLIKFRRNMARYCYYIETIFLCMSLSDISCGCYYIETFRTYLTGYNFFDCLIVEVQQFCFWYDLLSLIWSIAWSQCMWSTGDYQAISLFFPLYPKSRKIKIKI